MFTLIFLAVFVVAVVLMVVGGCVANADPGIFPIGLCLLLGEGIFFAGMIAGYYFWW